MFIAINCVLKYTCFEKEVFERVLWIDISEDMLITINISDTKSLPKINSLKDIEEMIESYDVMIVEVNNELIVEEKLSESSKSIRNNRWDIIKELVSNEPDIYFSKERWNLLKNVAQEKSVSEKYIYKYLRLYWTKGKGVNSLLPNYNKCGGKGLFKNDNGIKRGTNNTSGININENIRDIIKKSYEKFYNNKNKLTISQAYQRMLETYFYKYYYTNEQGNLVPLIDNENAPTLRQFRYWGKKLFSTKNFILSRNGETQYLLKGRPVLGEATSKAFAPGREFQIDATVGDIYLVSRYNKDWIIGRPVIYMVIDTFSRMIVGFYVGLEGPSWLGAMMALYNTAINKVKLCEEYGIKINDDQWNCNHLPDSLVVDRGEFEGEKPLNLVNNLGVTINILPPYRADWKPIIEQNFRRFNNKSLHWLPGTIKKEYRVRGDEDYRLGALLNLEQLTKIVIYSILYFNNNYMGYYERDEQMINDNVSPVPKELWKWGIKNRSGLLKSYPEDILKLSLMPSKEVSLTYRGVLFQKERYFSEELLDTGTFEHVRKYGRKKVTIYYEPRKMEYIYLYLDSKIIKLDCILENKKNYYYEEIQCSNFIERLEGKKGNKNNIQNTAELNANIDFVVNEAKKEYIKPKISKRQRVLSIRENRKQEREEYRKEQAWEIAKDEVSKEESIEDCENDDVYIPRKTYSDIVTMDIDKDGKGYE